MKGASLYCIASFLGVNAIVSQSLHEPEHYEKQFVLWQKQFAIKFADEQEYVKRLHIFISTSDMIEKHNSESSTYTMGHNAYSHLTTEEFAEMMRLTPVNSNKLKANSGLIHKPPSNISVTPTSWDWSEKGAVTDVKDQGKCS
jgi:hypothetical protein